jgi:hypothetical protein
MRSKRKAGEQNKGKGDADAVVGGGREVGWKNLRKEEKQ